MSSATTNPTLGPTRTRVLELWNAGLNGMEIARTLRISHQRVYDHLKELRRRALIEERSA